MPIIQLLLLTKNTLQITRYVLITEKHFCHLNKAHQLQVFLALHFRLSCVALRCVPVRYNECLMMETGLYGPTLQLETRY